MEAPQQQESPRKESRPTISIPEIPVSPRTNAANTIEQLSLSSPLNIMNGVVQQATEASIPEPIVMSRGSSNSNNNNNNNGDERQHRRNSQDQIVLTANHQQRLSSRSLQQPPHNNQKAKKSQKGKSKQPKSAEDNEPAAVLPKLLVAPISGALGWMKQQNDKAKREKLKQMAEEQMHVLMEAQKTDPSINFTVSEEDNFNLSMHGPHQQEDDEEQIRQQDEDDDYYDNDASQDHSQSSYHNEDDISWIPKVRCVEERPLKSQSQHLNSSSSHSPTSRNSITDPTKPVPFILTPEQMHDIARYVLPKGIAFCQWKRLYSLSRDGDSFLQCLRLCGTAPRTLMVVKTTRGDLFGGYADSPWERQHQTNGTFFGSAQACLYSFSLNDENGNAAPTTQDDNENKSSNVTPHTAIRVFSWTGANRYIQLTDTSEDKRRLAFGGGGHEGAFGLCVEQDFQQGSTGPCDTFGNEPLCDQGTFHILDLEIWGFLTGQF